MNPLDATFRFVRNVALFISALQPGYESIKIYQRSGRCAERRPGPSSILHRNCNRWPEQSSIESRFPVLPRRNSASRQLRSPNPVPARGVGPATARKAVMYEAGKDACDAGHNAKAARDPRVSVGREGRATTRNKHTAESNSLEVRATQCSRCRDSAFPLCTPYHPKGWRVPSNEKSTGRATLIPL